MYIRSLIINETQVLSSWISDLTLQKNQSDVTMTLLNGRKYRVSGVGADLYSTWVASPSKGKFWHQQIKNNYITTRLL